MSEWLQALGKRSLTSASDISDTNYEEFTRLDHDNVKAVNEANDAFISDLSSETDQRISFYNSWYKNKSSQYESLADLTQSGMKVAYYGLQLNETRKNYDDAKKHYDEKSQDPIIKLVNEKILGLQNDSKELHVITNRADVRDNLTIWDKTDLATSFDQLTVLIEDTKDLVKLGGPILESWVDMALKKPIVIQRDDGSFDQVLYTDTNSLTEKQRILDTVGVMYLGYVREKTDYDEGFIRKYITYPLLEKQELALADAGEALGKAKEVQLEQTYNEQFFSEITSARESGGESTVIADRIAFNYQLGDGELSWNEARAIAVGKLSTGIKEKFLNKEDIIWIGKEKIMPHGKTKPKDRIMFKDLFPKEYQALISEVTQRDITEANEITKGLEAQQIKIEQRVASAVRENGIAGARAEILQGRADWQAQFGDSIPMSPAISKYYNALENKVDYGALKEKLEYHSRWKIPISEDLYSQLPDPQEVGYWKAVAQTIPPTGWEQEAIGIGQTEYFNITNKSSNRWLPSERNALNQKSKEIFLDAYTAHMRQSAETNIPLSTRMQDARKAGNDAVETQIEEILKNNQKYFIDYGRSSDEELNIAEAKKVFVNGLADGSITQGSITSPELLFSGEDLLLLRGAQYLNGELGKNPPAEWQVIAKYTNLNAHDLITARLEATGNLPEGVKADYSNENGSIFPMQDGTNYRMLLRSKNGENIHVEFAQVLDRSRINSDKGGYNFIQLKGQDVETEIPAEEMTVGQIADIAVENGFSKELKLGMYNISGADLKIVLQDLARHDPDGSFLNRKFDQDLQDELIFLLYRSKLNQSKTLQGITPQSWAQTFNIPQPLAKELIDIYPFLKDTPYMQLQHLIPDAIPVLQEALAGKN